MKEDGNNTKVAGGGAPAAWQGLSRSPHHWQGTRAADASGTPTATVRTATSKR